MMVLLAGFPVWWALGAAPFAPIVIAAGMGALLVAKGRLKLVPGLLPWFALLFWAAAASINVPDGGTALGFLQRLGNLGAVGIFMLYYVNAKENLNPKRLLKGFGAVWLTVVVLGLCAMAWPEIHLTTPVGLLLPGSLTKNPLVYDLVFPPLAEIQQPWGAPEPYIRPAAPFPYANSWGVAFALLTPAVLYLVTVAKRWWTKLALLAGMAISILPALATSNRGMLVGVAVGALYVVVRIGLRGQVLKVAGMGLAVAAVFGVLLASGALSEILGRQVYSDSTSGRLSIYDATLAATLNSPLLGYGAPRMDATIGVSLGTQGYIWMLMFSFGFVGLALFLYFLCGGILRTWRAPATAGLWLHAIPITALAIIPFYSLDIMQMTIVALALAVLLRAKYYGEALDGTHSHSSASTDRSPAAERQP